MQILITVAFEFALQCQMTLLAYIDHSSPTKSQGILVIFVKVTEVSFPMSHNLGNALP